MEQQQHHQRGPRLQRVSANRTRSFPPIMHVACTDILPIDSSFCATAFTLDCQAHRETVAGAAAFSADGLGRYSKAQVSDIGFVRRGGISASVMLLCNLSLFTHRRGRLFLTSGRGGTDPFFRSRSLLHLGGLVISSLVVCELAISTLLMCEPFPNLLG